MSKAVEDRALRIARAYAQWKRGSGRAATESLLRELDALELLVKQQQQGK